MLSRRGRRRRNRRRKSREERKGGNMLKCGSGAHVLFFNSNRST
jgi:hypothetical protein